MARHQIILIGRRMDTALLGVKDFHPDVVHLLFTERTSEVYHPFLKMLPEGTTIVECPIGAYDALQVMRVCRAIRTQAGEGDVFQYNLTEGTKVAATAAARIAMEFDDDMIYYSQEGECINLRTFGREPILSRISNEEFIQLYDNELNSYSLASDILPVDLATALDVKHFIEHNQKLYQKIQHQFRSRFGGRIEHLPPQFRVEREEKVIVTTNGGALKINRSGTTLFEDDNKLSTRLFFTGRWWEVIVSSVVLKWDRERHFDSSDSQVWRSVEFRGSRNGKTKNEIDILVNDRRRLLLIECKSGYIAQENVYKIDSTRETYGGGSSKGVLVSYYPLDEELARKCRDLHVYYFAPEKESERYEWIKGLPTFLDKVVSEIE